VQEWRGRPEKLYRPPERRKALKGKAQERWKLKKASKDVGGKRREGSQTLSAGCFER